MAIPVLDLSTFLSQASNPSVTIIDARSEGEYGHAHIPGAVNIPLMNNSERIIVGTVYKQKGRDEAIKTGFELIGPKFFQIIAEAEQKASSKTVLLYCWRGGMRSNILAWVLGTYGFNVSLLKGGYKSFRNYVIHVNSQPRKMIVLGGPTCSGKTEILHQIGIKGEQIIDLEGLAHHKGSAFGGLGLPPQPSNEQFENTLAWELMKSDPEKWLWIENESRTIGSCHLPETIFTTIRNSPLIDIELSKQERVKRVKTEYAQFPIETLIEKTEKIKKRLGPQHLKAAVMCLQEGDINGWIEIVMHYYDKLYGYGNSLRNAKIGRAHV